MNESFTQADDDRVVTRSYGLYLIIDDFRETATTVLSDNHTEVCLKVGEKTYEMTFDEFVRKTTCNI